jgi:hypothetical protein
MIPIAMPREKHSWNIHITHRLFLVVHFHGTMLESERCLSTFILEDYRELSKVAWASGQISFHPSQAKEAD